MATFLYWCGQIVGWLHNPLFFAASLFANWHVWRVVFSGKAWAPGAIISGGASIVVPGSWLAFGGCAITWLEDWLKHFAKPHQTIWETSGMHRGFAWVSEYWWVQYLIGPLIMAAGLAMCVRGIVLFVRQRRVRKKAIDQSRS